MDFLGKLITFEGGDGSGKSTQLQMLNQYLIAKSLSTCLTKEPGGTEVGKELRALLVTGDKDKFDPIAEALLYYADRRVHLCDKIWPEMKKGAWVLSDRFADSTVAYQYYGYNKKVSIEVLDNLYNMTVGDFKPDLTIIFDIDPKIGLARSMNKANTFVIPETRHESREIEFHNNLRNGFLEIAKNEPMRCVVLDANKSIEELHQHVLLVIKERFDI